MDFRDDNRRTRAPHPPESPDSAPSDFFLFVDVKRQLSQCSFDDTDDLLTAVQEILYGCDVPPLIGVFDEWIRRQEQCFERHGEYVE
jgi:hypothetical protein